MTDAIRSALEAARAQLINLNDAIDDFWNDPTRPSVATMRSGTVSNLSIAQLDARASLAKIDAALASLDAPQGEGVQAINEPQHPIPWPDPTPEMLDSPRFNAIWHCIKSWDINVPEAYGGYCGATGNHVRAILDALDNHPAPQPDALREAENAVSHAFGLLSSAVRCGEAWRQELDDAKDRALAALSAALEGEGWRGMDTIPQNGDYVLILFPQSNIPIPARPAWPSSDDVFETFNAGIHEGRATAWMPLPTPPAGE